jgi:hypothetical protein
MRSPINIKYIISRTALILIGTIIALVIVELALNILPVPNRLKLLENMDQLWESDDELLLHLKPNLDIRITGHPEFSFNVQTNENGLRDESFVGTYDIAAIGDSFTFGFGVEESKSWPSQLEAMSGLKVANLGWAGWNSYVYPTTIRRYAIPLGTRIWIWTFFSNDLPESYGAERFLSSGRADYLEWVGEGQMRAGNLPFPYDLRSVQLLAALYNPELFLLPDSGDRIFDNGKLRMRVGPYAWEKTDFSKKEVQQGWELTMQALEEAQTMALSNDATLVVVFIPNREHVYWSYIKGLMGDLKVDQLDDLMSRLGEFCTSKGILYIDLLPAFREQANAGKMLYYPADGHWNESGHALAAETILGSLIQHGLISGE